MNSVATTAPEVVLYREDQPYRELPPVMFLVVVSALSGLGLFIWTVLLDRPLGALEVPAWLGVVLALGFGIVLPALFLRMRQTTLVYADRVAVETGMSGTHEFIYDDVTAVEKRTGDLRDDYSNRNVGTKDNTRVAYSVNGLKGAQLVLVDGRFILIGSRNPEELTRAIDTAWQAATISHNLMNLKSDPPRYREIQRWSDVWVVMVIVMAVAAVQWWGMIQLITRGGLFTATTAADGLMVLMWLAFGLGLPVLAFWLRLVVEVYPDKIIINYRPLTAKTVIMLNVISVEPRIFGPVPAISGWGARDPEGIRAFNISGTTSVQLTLRDRTRLLIGTNSPDRLAAAIAAARYDVKK